MIERKIILDKRGIWSKKIITLILVILVVASVLIFLFRVDINNYLRNLPGYSVPEEDEEIDVSNDEELKDLCPVKIGTIGVPEGGKQYIYFDGEKTNLYWDADEKEGYVKIEGTKVAEVEEGIVSVNPGFFNSDSEFDLDSEIYQKIRFIPKVDVSYFVKIHKSYYAGSNLLCKGEEEDIEIDYGFPDNPIILDTESLKLEKIKRKIFDYRLKIDFSPYVTLPEDCHFKFLFIKNGREYIEIRGHVSAIENWVDLGSIYPDGSVWLNRERLTEDGGAKISSEVVQMFRGIYKPYYESNLRVDYEEIKKIL